MEYQEINHKNLNPNNPSEDKTWEGLSGQEVYTIITDSLNDLSHNLAQLAQESGSSIKDITIKTKEGDTNTLQYYYTNQNDILSETKEVTLTPTSSDIGTIIITNNIAPVIQLGTSINVDYQWEVTDISGTKKAYSPAKIHVIINDIDHDAGDSVNAVRTNTNKDGSFQIKSEWLVEGLNTIIIKFDTSYLGQAVQISNQGFTVNALNPVLNITWNANEPYSKLFEDDEPLSLNLSVTNSKGQTIRINNTIVDPTYRFYYGTNINPLSLKSGDINQVTLLQIYHAADNQGSISADSDAKIFVQAAITGENFEVTSDIYLLQYLRKDATGFQFSTVQKVQNRATQPLIIANQYDEPQFKLYAYSVDSAEVTISSSDPTISAITKAVTPSQITNISYSNIFKSAGDYTLSFVTNNNKELSYQLQINKIGDILELDSNIAISLHAKGQSKSSIKEWSYGSYKTSFSYFDWSGNGWDQDVLKINNGARADINFHPFATNGFTVSFKFQAEYGAENDRLIYCGNDTSTFFAIYPEKAIFKVNGVQIQTEYNSTDVHEITFVRYLYGNGTYLISIYVDGVCQKTAAVTADNNNSFTPLLSDITLTAAESNLLVYDIMGYAKALSFYKIQAIYNYNTSNATAALNYVKAQNILTSAVLGDNTNTVKISNLPIGARYMVISSFGEDDAEPWRTITSYTGDTAEVSKKIRHAVGNIKFIEKIDNEGTPSPRNFCVDRATLSAQGTSSMYYPIKNFRIYFKKTITEGQAYYNQTSLHGDKVGDFCFSNVIYTGIGKDFYITNSTSDDTYEVHNNNNESSNSSKVKYSLFSTAYGDSYTSAPVNIFCLKADYAESSGSHNTGFARMANDVLSNTRSVADSNTESTKLPQQVIVESAGASAKYKYDIRSTIDGMPVYLFFKPYDAETDDDAIYFGKYNFNNEKATAETYGFEGIHDYFSNSIVETEADRLRGYFNDTVARSFDITHNKYSIDADGKYNDKGTTFVNPTECWEFSNNTFQNINIINGDQTKNNLGAFEFPYDDNNNPFTVRDNSGELAWLSQAWEYRYPDIDDGSTADNLYTSGSQKPFLLNSLYKWLYDHSYPIHQDINKLEDFANNLNKYFNINYLLKYFMLTKMFGNIDQRIKNCMLAFICDPLASENTDTNTEMGHMRAFYIFYDNDTIMGVDNNGDLTQPWNIDEDVYPGYGKHAVWDNLEECHKLYMQGKSELSGIYKLGKKIETTYQVIRQYLLTNDKITNYFVNQQEGYFPDVIHNIDEEIKYIYHENFSDYGENLNNISKYQGNRRYHRKRWLEKRLNWFDAKFNGGKVGDYKYGFKIATTNSLQNGGSIEITSALKDWRFYIKKQGNLISESKLLDVNQKTSLTLPNNAFSISDYVDIVGLYGAKELNLSNFQIKNPLASFDSAGIFPYLEKFTVNTINDDVKVFNAIAIDSLLNADRFPALTELYLCNVTCNDGQFNTLNLSQLLNLQIIDCRNTNINVTLPNSSHLTTLSLYRPTTLTIENKPNLQLSLANFDRTSQVTKVEGLKGNNSSVYITLLNIAKSNNLSGSNARFIFQQSDESRYMITPDEAELAYELRNNNPDISGKISTQLLDTTLAGNLTTTYPNLIVDNSDTGDFEINIDGNITAVNEGQTVKFLSNTLLSQGVNGESYWSYQVTDYDTGTVISNQIFDTITQTNTYIQFKLKDPQNNRTEFHYVLEVYANNFASVKKSVELFAVKINSWTASASKTIVNQNDIITIYVTANPIKQTKYANSSYTYTYTNDTESTYQPTITIGSEIVNSLNTINFIIDQTISYALYPWLKIVLDQSDVTIDEREAPKISTLQKLTLNNTVISLLNEYQGKQTSPMNMDIVKYFTPTSSSFVIPSLNFSNFTIPDALVTDVTWSIPSSNTQYAKIKFGEKVKRIDISGTSLQCYDLQLDLSDCTSINEISSSKSQNNIAHINLSFIHASSQGSPTIICPNTISSIGTLEGLTSSNSGAVFIYNIVNTDSQIITNGNSVQPYIQIASRLANLGEVCSSPVGRSIITTQSNSVSLYPSQLMYAAYKNKSNIIEDNLVLDTIIIGDYSFYNYSTNLTLTLQNVQQIGRLAFGTFAGIKHTLNINTNNLISIGEQAFSCTSTTRNSITLNGENTDFQTGANSFNYCDITTTTQALHDKMVALRDSGQIGTCTVDGE